MNPEKHSLVRRGGLTAPTSAAFFGLDFSRSMGEVAPSVVRGYEQCRQEWMLKIPHAQFIPVGFHFTVFFLTQGLVTAAQLPTISEAEYRERLRSGSQLINVFKTGLQLAIERQVGAVLVMSDGWEHAAGAGHYESLRNKFLPPARELGCCIRLLVHFNPRLEKQLWEFINLGGLREDEYIIFRDQEFQTRVEQTMIGLRDEVLKIHGQ